MEEDPPRCPNCRDPSFLHQRMIAIDTIPTTGGYDVVLFQCPKCHKTLLKGDR